MEYFSLLFLYMFMLTFESQWFQWCCWNYFWTAVFSLGILISSLNKQEQTAWGAWGYTSLSTNFKINNLYYISCKLQVCSWSNSSSEYNPSRRITLQATFAKMLKVHTDMHERCLKREMLWKPLKTDLSFPKLPLNASCSSLDQEE